MKYVLRSSFERKFDKTNFISPKRTPPKSPHRLGLTYMSTKKVVSKPQMSLVASSNMHIKVVKICIRLTAKLDGQ